MKTKKKDITYYHAPLEGNPWKGGIINVKTDAPNLPIALRQKQENLKHKLLGLGGRW